MRWVAPLLLLVLPAVAAWAQASESPDREEEATVEGALELRLRLEELLERLSPELRAEFERRWAQDRLAAGKRPPEEGVEEGVGEAAIVAPSLPAPEAPARREPQSEPPSEPVAAEPPAADPPAVASTGEKTRVQLPPETAVETPPDAPGSAPAQEEVPLPVPEPAEPHEHSCNTLYVLDTNGDGSVSGADRFWRYLSLWIDDGNGVVETTEVKSLFKHRVGKVSARLYSYTTTKDADGGIWVEERIYFDLAGRGRKSRAALTLNAGGLGRSDDTWVADGNGQRLEGYVPIGPGIALQTAEGGRYLFLCR